MFGILPRPNFPGDSQMRSEIHGNVALLVQPDVIWAKLKSTEQGPVEEVLRAHVVRGEEARQRRLVYDQRMVVHTYWRSLSGSRAA